MHCRGTHRLTASVCQMSGAAHNTSASAEGAGLRMDFSQGFVATRSLKLAQVHLAAVLAISAITIGGCASTAERSRNSAHRVESIPLPDPALLRRQPKIDCAFRGPVSNPITAEETRQKLDYEQQCYQATERILRARLVALQDAVQKTIKAARQR